MSNLYKVSINVDSAYGHIAYNEQTKEITVEFPIAEVKAAIVSYLSRPHLINEPNSPSTYVFEEREYLAKNSKHDFQIVLSRIYNSLAVHVNWSIPADIDMNNI